jgi:hypothetical protein
VICNQRMIPETRLTPSSILLTSLVLMLLLTASYLDQVGWCGMLMRDLWQNPRKGLAVNPRNADTSCEISYVQ